MRPFFASFASWSVSLALAALLACLWAAHPDTASAQDDKARARTLFGEGVAAFDRGEYEQALAAFEQAYRLAPHPAVRVNMANCFEQLGRYVEARFNYERFLEETGSAVDPQQRSEIEGALANLASKIGKLVVVLIPREASLTVDGAPAQLDPSGALELASGMHTLRATSPGYLSAERLLQVEAATERRIVLELARDTPAAPVAETLSPPVQEPLPAFQADTHEATQGGRLRPAVWIALGSAVLFGAGAGISGGLALKAQNDFDGAVETSRNEVLPPAQRMQARADGLDAADRADMLATVTDVLLAGAAVSATTALVLWLIDRRDTHRDQPVSVEASVSEGSVHGVLKGAF